MTHFDTYSGASSLRLLADDLDPSPERRRDARERYTSLGEFLSKHAGETVARDVNVYPQGSFLLGTTTRDPFTDEFDVDLVIRVNYHKSEISQRDLNNLVGGWLNSYTTGLQSQNSPLAPSRVESGSRAWTLTYPDNFHIDALAVAASRPGEIQCSCGTPEWLTDRAFRNWLPTNPSGLAEWFKGLNRRELQKRAKTASVEVEDLLPDQTKSTLQRSVQILKRHRDHSFRDDNANLVPPSVLITVLAGLAYERVMADGGDVGEVLRATVPVMPEFLQGQPGELWLPNPTCSDENYADRYDGRPDKEKALLSWIEEVDRDLRDLDEMRGLDSITKQIDRAFGTGYGRRVAEKVGTTTRDLREAGKLFTSGLGGLTTESINPRPNREHTFYGETP